jgi:phosphotransferase system HPr (HPr) family protein
MPEVILIVHHEVGLHARPAALFVQVAQGFDADINVSHGEREANAKSMLGILTLGVGQGAEIVIRAEGQDADEALSALQQLIESDFVVEE